MIDKMLDKVIDKMMKSKKWPQNKYFGMTKDQIKLLWSENGKKSSTQGTLMHYQIECFYNDMDVEVDEDNIEWQYFDERSYIDAKKVQDGEDAYSRNKFNQAASDKLASNRVIPDTRSTQCKARKWPHEDLQETSVIITFHNEARSTLLRTIVR